MRRPLALSVAALVSFASLHAFAAPKASSKAPSAPTRLTGTSMKKLPPPPPPPPPAPPAPSEPVPSLALALTPEPAAPPTAALPTAAPPAAAMTTTAPERPTTSMTPRAPADRDVAEREPSDTDRANAFEGVFGRGSDFLGFGFGMRFRHSMRESGLVVGGSVVTFVQTAGAFTFYQPSMTTELGYEFRPGQMKIVPYVGAGAHFLVASGAFDVSPLVTPGLALRYEPSRSGLTVGLDMRMYVTKVEAMPIGAFLTLGARF